MRSALSNEFSIRDANTKDLDIIASFFLDLHKVHIERYPHIFRDMSLFEARKFLEDKLVDRSCFVRVVSLTSDVVGYSLSRLKSVKESALVWRRETLFLDHIFISNKVRRTGAARLLIEDLSKIAEEYKAKYLETDAWDLNQQAFYLFDNTGFRAMNTFLYLKV